MTHTLSRPGGVELAVVRRGEGPAVLLAVPFFSPPSVYRALADDLARDHTVVTFDPRGSGDSTRTGPYDIATDTADVEAVARAEGPFSAAIGFGYMLNRLLEVRAAAPSVFGHVITPAGNPLGRWTTEDSDGYGGSRSVIDMMLELARTDFRAFLRTTITSTNPQLDEDGIRERVERASAYTEHAAVLERARSWAEEDAREYVRSAGDAFSVLHHPGNPWFSDDVLDRMRADFPAARIHEVEDGALSRPDLTTAVVRGITGVASA